ncbi:MAG: glycosyltransferase family 2 protein [Clostridia bacterium]|nr:glycosyltransferase family 2 protein [Clostridia bacterium]
MKTMQVILVIKNILTFILMFYAIYQVVFAFLAYMRPVKKKKIINKKHKFMAIVSARNEEKVIANLIESLKEQHYPKNKLDIYVIADNCTDKTAEIARKSGAIVYERFDETKRSKGYALEWFFDRVLDEFPDKYDAFCVFDADNLVTPGFINKMNEKLCEGEKLVQGYRDIKNVDDNWISANSAIYYWTLNKMYHYARYNMGLSAFIQGTGFMVSMDIIKEEGGWHTTALTEDIEFSFTQIARGRKIAWAHDAVVFDEQPTSLSQVWNQRLRWGVGHIQSMGKCIPKLYQCKKVTPVIIDAFIYLMSFPILFVSIITSVLNFLSMSTLTSKEIISQLGVQLFTSVLFILGSILQVIIVLKLEKRSLKQVWQGIVTYPIFLGITYVVNACAIFNTNMAWKPIEHVKAVKISELQK